MGVLDSSLPVRSDALALARRAVADAKPRDRQQQSEVDTAI